VQTTGRIRRSTSSLLVGLVVLGALHVGPSAEARLQPNEARPADPASPPALEPPLPSLL